MIQDDDSMDIRIILSDLRILCNSTNRDMEQGDDAAVSYYFDEINRIIDLLKNEMPKPFEDVKVFEINKRALNTDPDRYRHSMLGRINSTARKLRDRLKIMQGYNKIDANTLVTLETIFSSFHQVARQLRQRHNSRPTLEIQDEYDVQDLLHAILKLYFDDIRAEEWTPSYAGGSSRMDFVLQNEQVVIEVKKTSDTQKDKQIGDQLIVDALKYKRHPDCKSLACFIYDPEGKIGNPKGLENDLGKLSTDILTVKAFVFPK